MSRKKKCLLVVGVEFLVFSSQHCPVVLLRKVQRKKYPSGYKITAKKKE